MVDEWVGSPTPIIEEFIEKWNLRVDLYPGESREDIIYKIQQVIIRRISNTLRIEDGHPIEKL